MDDNPLDDHLETDADSFAEWIEQVAASRGVSQDELLHQLMSSYWMMDELASVIDDLEIDPGRGLTNEEYTEADPPSGRGLRGGGHREATESAASETDTTTEPNHSESERYDETLLALVETLKDWKSEREGPETPAVDKTLIDLIEVVQEGNQPPPQFQSSSAGRDRTDAELDGVNETVQLIRALKEFNEPSTGSQAEQRLASESKLRELEEDIVDLETEIKSVSREVDTVDASSQERIEDLAADLNELASRLDALEASIDSAADGKTVEKLEEAVSELADQITTTQNRVDAHFEEVESEFENVEQILTHLFDEVESDTADTEALEEQLSKIQNRLRVLDDLEAAGELKRKANRAGIATATCESCEESVDVGQLSAPECPYCNTEFDGLASDKKWGIFSHHTLTQANPDQNVQPR